MTHPLSQTAKTAIADAQAALVSVMDLHGDYLPEEAVVAGERYGAFAGYGIGPNPALSSLSQTKGGWKTMSWSVGIVLSFTASSYQEAMELSTTLPLDLSAAIPDIIDQACLVETMKVNGYEEPGAIDSSVSMIIKNQTEGVHLVTVTTEFRINFLVMTDISGRPKQ